MKAFLASILAATLLWGCGGGGGNAGNCSGSPEYCAEFAEDSGLGGATGGTSGAVSLAFSKAGSGDAVFELPAHVTRLRIQASYKGDIHTFFVDIAGEGVVFAAVGNSVTPPAFDGTYLVPGGATVEIWGASGVEWLVTQASE